MEYKRINYKNLILKEIVIPKLRNDIDRLNNNVLYTYPNESAKFPLVVVNISDSPNTYDIGQYELINNITVSMNILEEYQSDCMDLEFDITNCMFELGFTRLEPTEPYKNERYDKFQIDIRYKIAYNTLDGTLIRTL